MTRSDAARRAMIAACCAVTTLVLAAGVGSIPRGRTVAHNGERTARPTLPPVTIYGNPPDVTVPGQGGGPVGHQLDLVLEVLTGAAIVLAVVLVVWAIVRSLRTIESDEPARPAPGVFIEEHAARTPGSSANGDAATHDAIGSGPVVDAWRGTERDLARHGVHRQATESSAGLARRGAGPARDAAPDLVALERLYTRAVYGDPPADDRSSSDADAAEALAGRVREGLDGR